MSESPKEACSACGEETATGSVRFSGRRVLQPPDRLPAYVCEFCLALAAERRHGHKLSDEELQHFIERGSIAGMVWGGPVTG